jgi:DNA-binding transcriptional LysR family regulator
MRFKGLDLNLLVALDVLLTEANVSRAADKLCLSQSATSGALARLRDYFGDDLLVQVGRKMVLTPRAKELSGKVRASLAQIDGTIIQAPEFDPRTVKREVRIIASDSVLISALQGPMHAISELAPGLVLSIEAPGNSPRDRLERGEIDMLAMPELYLSPDHPFQPYYQDEYVVAAWEQNSWLGDSITEEQFYEARHAAVQFATFTPSYEDWFMRNRAEDREIAVQAGSFSSLPFLLLNTDLIGLMHRRLAERFREILPLKFVPSPIEMPAVNQCIQWHSYAERDECLAWVRARLMEAFEGETSMIIRETDDLD